MEKWADHIDGCVCQTQWHADEYVRQYPALKNKIRVINNGIDTELFPAANAKKVRNRFIYTSRTERGLTRILDLWPDIMSALPDATLVISTYVAFPCNDDERRIQARIAHLNQIHRGEDDDVQVQCIRHLGQLNHEKLYAEMGEAEYWLYPTDWPETSCITAMEMLMSGVICLYYPVAGLTETMGGCGIQISAGTEIETLVQIAKDEPKKEALRKQGRAYAESCSWANRAQQWSNTLKLSEPAKQNESILFFFPNWYNTLNLQDYIDGFRTIYKDVIQMSDPVHAIDAIDSDPTICTVMFVFEVSSEDVYNHCANICTGKRAAIELCILNTEPLNLQERLRNIKMHLTKYDGIPVHDYSLSNLKILNDNGFKNTHHMPYILHDEEQNALKMLNAQTKKMHDFGIISDPMMLERRTKVITFLMDNGYTVKVITGYNKHERDAQVACCRMLLNIHGSLRGEDSTIFEHIRCDRLLAAGYHILSEECLHLDPDFMNEHAGNLKLIPYSAFFAADVIAKCFAALLNSNTKSRKIIDCFIFYNELEMLAYRLHVLGPTVDYFILVEARQTHVGADKPLHYEENKHQPRFAQLSEKIIHIVVDLPHLAGNVDTSRDDQWTNERFQRNCISRGLEKIAAHLDDRDAIIIADLDEIPDPTTLTEIKNHYDLLPLGIYRLEQDFYYYNLNSQRNEKWYHCKMLTFQKYKELNMSCDAIRFFNCDSIAKGGWHLSYFGDSQFIKNKLENFAHQEYNSEQYTDLDAIQKKIDSCVDLFNRGTCINQMQRVAICDNQYLPPFYKTHLASFYVPLSETAREQKLVQVLTHEFYGSAWTGHFEFSMWLVKHVNPKIIVELGVDYGHSTFCLASPNIGTVYAIDCFEGDAHAGFKQTEHIFTSFKNELVQRSLLISDNIIPIKGYFDDVIKTPMFAQSREIDILHIDGLHTYEAVKNDFCKWSLKTSHDAVIIMHDVVSYPDTVGRLFNEIEFPKFYFTHSAGLGVVCKSEASLMRLLQELHAANLPCCEFIRTCNARASRKKYCFIHSCTFLHSGTVALDYIVDKINASGLIDALDAVFINNIGIPIEENKYNKFLTNSTNNDKYSLTNYSKNERLHENPTLNKLKQFSENNKDSYVLYLHTKGNSYPNARQEITDWTNMMLYFLVETHEDCFRALDGAHDTVGCNHHAIPAHYSGNFWWAKTNHIATLPSLNEDVPDKMATEFWLFQNNPNNITACTLHSSGINHYHEAYPRRRYVRTKRGHHGLVVGFHSNQLCERGTEVALFDYAFYNQTLYGNKSIIFYDRNNPNNHSKVISRFETHFKCYAYTDFAEIDSVLLSEGADYFYSIGQGMGMQLVSACPNCLHDVFQMQPHGERYATVSRHLALSFNRPDIPSVPHIVHFRSDCSDNLREMLGIPGDAIVFGRYGGFNQFDIGYVHEAICEFIQMNANSNAYFIFANTRAFCEHGGHGHGHKQIIHVETLYDETDKLKFINTCDAMIHARSDGETFGLSIAEFSIKNKPVITTHSSIPNSNAHIDMLGERAVIYRNKTELLDIFENMRQIAASREDWNAYADYNPESVMRQFMKVFID
jgi:beta-1,4-mannosyl-glycoprotein beta-1,4-N-acetylglucosaminyltransferase